MEAPAITLKNIESAVYQLYYEPSPAIKNTAQRWLTYAQQSNEAWSFSWELLQPGQSTEAQYFGASALVAKIRRSWSEVPKNEVESLRDKVFSEILRLCKSPQEKIVLTRMCVAFAALVMNCMVDGEWSTAVVDVMSKLQSEDQIKDIEPMQRCSALLEILTVIAEEFHTSRLDRQSKGIVKHRLAQGTPHVMPLLTHLLSSDEFKAMHNKVLKCFSSWIVMGIPFDENSQLLHLALSYLNDSELFESSVECLLQAFCAPESISYPNTIKSLIPKVLALRPMFHKAVEDQDSDVCLGLTKVICGLAENHTKLILQNFSNVDIGLGLITLVAECTAINLQYPIEESSSPIAFTFWFSLQDEVESFPDEKLPQIFPQVKSIFIHLIDILMKKATYPGDNSHMSWSSDEKERHRVYRVDISDSLMFILEMLGSDMIQFLCCKFTAAVKSSQPWQVLETLLFAIYSTVESTLEWDDGLNCLNELASLIPSINIENVTLADTVLSAIGALTDWITYTPQHLRPLIAIVLPCIWNQDLALTTVLTLKRITRECAKHILPYAGDILRTAQDALTKGVLVDMEVTWLMHSIGHVLSVLPEDDCIQQLQQVLMLHLHQLQALSEDPPSAPSKNSILHILDILKCLFLTLDRRRRMGASSSEEDFEPANTDEKQPVLLVLQQLTPILQEILNKWVTDSEIVSAICKMYDNAIRNLLDGFAPLIPTLCDTLSKIFQNAPQVSVLTLTEQITLTFGNDAEHKYPIGVLFRSIIETCRCMFEGGHAKDHPDLAQGFMDLLSHVLKKNKDMLSHDIPGNPPLPRPDLDLLYRCCLDTFSLPESESVKSAASFLLGLLKNGNLPLFQSLLAKNGREIYHIMMQAIAGQAQRTVMDHVADVLHGLAKLNSQVFISWIQESMKADTFPWLEFDPRQKAVFFSGLLRFKSTKAKFRELVSNFAIVCRGLYGTEYITN